MSVPKDTCYPMGGLTWNYYQYPEECKPEVPEGGCSYFAKYRWPEGRNAIEYEVFSGKKEDWAIIGWVDDNVSID